MATLTHLCLQGMTPSYLSADLHYVADIPERSRLWTTSVVELVIPGLVTVLPFLAQLLELGTACYLVSDLKKKKRIKTCLFHLSFPII